MIYTLTKTTPNDQDADNPLRSILTVTKGLVYRIEVEFRPGASGTLHIQIYDGGYQVWPSTPGESFNTDGKTIGFDDTYLKLNPPYQFDVLTWCESASYDHEIQVRIGMVSPEIFMARFLPTYGYQELTKILQDALTQQQADLEAQKQAVLSKPLSWVTPTEEIE